MKLIGPTSLDNGIAPFARRGAKLCVLLVASNVIAWFWAFVAFRDSPLLIGTAALAYSFGLRHALDADHIAAIDNVTRKLMQQGERPIAVGLYFSLGHSTIVVVLSIAIAISTAALQTRFETSQSRRSVAWDVRFVAVPVRHRLRQRTGADLDLSDVQRREERGAFYRGRPQSRSVKSRRPRSAVSILLSRHRAQLANVSTRALVRSRLRHGDGSGPPHHLCDAGVSRSAYVVAPDLSGSLHGRNDLGRHSGRDFDGRRLWLGVYQAYPKIGTITS